MAEKSQTTTVLQDQAKRDAVQTAIPVHGWIRHPDAVSAAATTYRIESECRLNRIPLGSGTPGNDGVENAGRWDMDIYHTPQYMPGSPTTSTVFPRTIAVSCVENENGIRCKGYNWLAEMGRAQYLMIRPIIVKETTLQK